MRLGALDQGTSSTRCLVVTAEGATLAAQLRHAQHHPAPDRVEHDPAEVLANLRAAMAAAGPVDAWALANQGETCLAWDEATGEALSPFIVWQDSRTAAALAARPAADHAASRRISGLPLDPYFSASKLAWLLDDLPGLATLRASGRLRLGTSDAWLIRNLTGASATDHTTASRTGLYDIAAGGWSAELCALHGVPMDCLPPIRDSDAGFGTVAGVPLSVAMTDQQAALAGHGCFAPGEMKITFGTGAFLLVQAGARLPESSAGLLPTVAWARAGQGRDFALEGGVYDVGSALDWARGTAGLFGDWSELAHFDGPSALSRGLVFVPAFSGLAAPDWDRFAAPVLAGFRVGTPKRAMAQALLEGIALLTARLVAAAAADLARMGIAAPAAIAVDGGVTQSDHFLRLLAAATGLPVRRAALTEATAAGLAALAGLRVATGAATGFQPESLLDMTDRSRFEAALALSRGWDLPKS